MVLSLDLETDGLYDTEDPKKHGVPRITCVGVMDEFGTRQFTSPWESWNREPDRAERMLLQAFVDSRVLHNGNTILSYNGNHFDMPLLHLRMQEHGLKDDFTGVPHADSMRFVTGLGGYRVRKETAASKYADIYTPKTTEAAYFARAYRFGLVTPQIQSKMLAHNAIDVSTTWNFHWDMMVFPDYRGFFEECQAGCWHPPSEKESPVEAFL